MRDEITAEVQAPMLHPLYSGSGPRDEVRGLIAYNFRQYKAYPLCRTCRMDCKMPNVPTLRLTCPGMPEYQAEVRTRGGNNV
jgi:hypothetical protein